MDPKYGEADSAPQWEYRQPTWEVFLTIREWAQEVANIEGYPVYLVGSALWKTYPRDIDISMLMPLTDFEARYGEIPKDDEEAFKGWVAHETQSYHDAAPYNMTLQERIHYSQRIDFKIQPDTWFQTRDKLLLAEPNGHVRVRGWQMYRRASE